MELKERLGKEWLFFDGWYGHDPQEHGLKAGELPETWNLTHPEEIISLNCGYFRRSSDVVNTNTFGANALKYRITCVGLWKRRFRTQEAGVSNRTGRTPISRLISDRPASCCSRWATCRSRAVELFREKTIRIGAAAGADLVLIETMSDSYEAKAAVLAAKENCRPSVLATMIFDEKGKLLTGGTVDSTVAMLEGLRVDALGVNCGLGPKANAADYKTPDTKSSSLPIIIPTPMPVCRAAKAARLYSTLRRMNSPPDGKSQR